MVGRPPETEIVVRAKRGDADAYEALLRMHEHIAFRTAYAIVGSTADAEEVTQEAFVKAYNALPRFRTGSPFGPGCSGSSGGTLNRPRALGTHGACSLRAAGGAASGWPPPHQGGLTRRQSTRKLLRPTLARLGGAAHSNRSRRCFIELSGG